MAFSFRKEDLAFVTAS